MLEPRPRNLFDQAVAGAILSALSQPFLKSARLLEQNILAGGKVIKLGFSVK